MFEWHVLIGTELVPWGLRTTTFSSATLGQTRAGRRILNSALRQRGLLTFFDRRNLPAGLPWVRALENTIGAAKAAIILIGPSGFGNTQQYERELAFIRQTREQAFIVVPVLLPGTGDPPFNFLNVVTWIDFSRVEKITDAPDEFQRLLTSVQTGREGAEAARLDICPYRGLDAFREEDSAFFFGRGSADDPASPIGQLVGKVRDHGFVMVVGRSGSGKSSLVFAGLVPALRREPSRLWNVLSLRPGPEPLRSLAAAFNPRTESEGAAEYAKKITKEADELRTGDSDLLSHMIREELDRAEGNPDRLLLYIDQWEEFYAQAPSPDDPGRSSRRAGDVTRFIDLLLSAARSAPVTVVGTVRADFYDPLISHPDIRSLLPNQQVLLGSMTRSELENTIVEPARMVGLTFDPPNLVQRILDDAGTDEGMLPLLQFALKETWGEREGRRLTGGSYTRSGGVREAIRTTAERTFEALSPSDQQAARQLFLRLVTPGEGQEDTRARAAMPTEVGQVRIVEQFASPRTRLLVTGFDRAKRPTVEVAHEALIRTWPRLHTWVDANRERLRSRSAILQAKADWEQNGRPDDLLLSPGFALARAKELVRDPGDIAVEDFQEFVTLSADRESKRAGAERAIELKRRTRRVASAIGLPLATALIFAGLYGYYSYLQQARLSAEAATRELQLTFQAQAQMEQAALDRDRDFRARVIAVASDAALSQRRISGAADALVLALAKPSNLPDVGEYVRVLYRGLSELRERRRIDGLQSQAFGASFNPKQRLLSAVTVGSPSLIHFWQDDGVFLDSVIVTEPGFIMNARWSPDGQRIYVGTSPTAHIITPCSHEALRKYFDVCRSTSNDISLAIGTIDNPAGNSGAWSRDGKWILTAGFQSPARLWDALTGDLVPSFVAAINDFRDSPAASVAISADMKRMAVGLVSGEILIVNPEAMTIEKTLKLPPSRRGGVPFSLAFDPKDSNLLLAAYQDPTAQLWNIDAETARPLVRRRGRQRDTGCF